MHRSNNLFSELTAQWTDQDKVAIETSAGKEYRYSDLLGITSRFAHALKATGVQPGDRVAVQVEKSPEALFLYLACLRAGAAYLPLNTAYTEAELDYFLRNWSRLFLSAAQASVEIAMRYARGPAFQAVYRSARKQTGP